MTLIHFLYGFGFSVLPMVAILVAVRMMLRQQDKGQTEERNTHEREMSKLLKVFVAMVKILKDETETGESVAELENIIAGRFLKTNMRYIFTQPAKVEVRLGIQVDCTEAVLQGWHYFQPRNITEGFFTQYVQIQYSLGFRDSSGRFVQVKEDNPTVSDNLETEPPINTLTNFKTRTVTEGRTWEEENVFCLFNLLVSEGHIPKGNVDYTANGLA